VTSVTFIRHLSYQIRPTSKESLTRSFRRTAAIRSVSLVSYAAIAENRL